MRGMLAPDRTFARRDTALFVLCIALSIGALFAPERWQYAAASSARSTALAPLIALQRRAESSRTSLARFELLTAERDSAAGTGAALTTASSPRYRRDRCRVRLWPLRGRRIRWRHSRRPAPPSARTREVAPCLVRTSSPALAPRSAR